MSYELRFSPAAEEAIEGYLSKRFKDGPEKDQAIDQIEGRLLALARNPRVAVIPPGPFGRPIHVFQIDAGGVQRALRVTFCYTDDEKAIRITGFSPVEF
jgi:hypothetical protein